ncbi:hypothetical protein L249_8597 [Ophiocordyceps polyrhachis-furcata BCC 54312]|uniref:Uncharacterized protein n=1 Tax=Ophiocordyceps polyrhachis-furcata BCC 54312 TaxID=1330021 RepID=A0A367L6V9_9HYPO|nr:hypothetical protein L249_8597 [Ophiocordyceps polyrhachis-furcata BCC 54312]
MIDPIYGLPTHRQLSIHLYSDKIACLASSEGGFNQGKGSLRNGLQASAETASPDGPPLGEHNASQPSKEGGGVWQFVFGVFVSVMLA